MNGNRIRAIVILTAIVLATAILALVERQKPALATESEQNKGLASRSASDATKNITFTAVGDIMLDRGVGDKIKELGAEFPFELVGELLSEADLTLGNLESPISSLGKATKGKEVNFRAASQVINGIRSAGIDVVSLANNHAMDYGTVALLETMDILAHSGVAYIGAGANSAAVTIR